MTWSPHDLTLADFYFGHDDDPLAAPADFARWRRDTAREQSLFRRTLRSAAGPRTRLRVNGRDRDVINLASLDYLGMNGDPGVAAAMTAAVESWGAGACGVPVLTGTTQLHVELEERVCALTGHTGAILFPSGFAGGIGLMGALLRRGDVAVADERAHMCWMDGVRQSGATLTTFAHNDPQDLDRVLGEHDGRRRLVVVDGLYSMDGDLANLPALLDVADAHSVGLVVDEAHSGFAIGPGGRGAAGHFGVEDRIRVYAGTFSKALSIVGGFVTGDATLMDYARFNSHCYAFSAAPPPPVVAAIMAAVEKATADDARRRTLAENAAYFRAGVQRMGLDTGWSTTHVVPIVLGSDRDLLYSAGLEMLDRGLYIVPIDFPAVPEDAVRFRAAISAAHTRGDLDTALQIIEDCVAVPLRRRRAHTERDETATYSDSAMQ